MYNLYLGSLFIQVEDKLPHFYTMPPPPRSMYKGPSRKLVIAFDIGTTFSGVSYSILSPGEIPEIFPVTRFPCQENVGGNCKIPTIIYYGERGEVRATGAEAMQELEDLGESDEVDRRMKAEWFKMHLRPKSSVGSDPTDEIPPLPPNKTAIDIFVDYMKYLCKCTRDYIQETFPNQPDFWASMERDNAIDYILTHPNGWEGPQQVQMRQAAIRAGLVPDTDSGKDRVHFVTEGEASLHLCINRGLKTPAMERGEGVVIVDAGGGTVDISTYCRNLAGGENSYEEIATAQCFFQGSIYVTNRARCFIEHHLRDSEFKKEIDKIVNVFDKKTKLNFRNKPIYIPFGLSRNRDDKVGIRNGALKLAADDTAKFFKPSIDCIVKAVTDRCHAAEKTISTVFLVGGFAASDWLFSQIKLALAPLGVAFYRPDSNVNKAVADGGVSYFIDHVVSARFSKYTYGIRCNVSYDSTNTKHLQRSSQVYQDLKGDMRLQNGFDTILPKDSRVSETTEFFRSYFRLSSAKSDFGCVSDPILLYKGISEPSWTDEDIGSYSTLCNVVVDDGKLESIAQYKNGVGGKCYYEVEYKIVLSFGLTELVAQFSWDENGVEKRSPAKVIYDIE